MHPGGYHQQWWELFALIFFFMLSCGLCCLVDKRRMHVASSSWPACVRRCRIFFFLFVVVQYVSTSTGTERTESCGVSVKPSLAHRETHRRTLQWLPLVKCDWCLIPKATCILQTKPHSLFRTGVMVGLFMDWRKSNSVAYIAVV